MIITNETIGPTFAQSIGHHTNVNLGFNPYLSPVFGYGLGLPFGAYGASPTKFHPWLSSSILGLTYGSGGNPLMSSLHAKTILKKIAPSSMGGYPDHTSFKDKLTALKHPEFSYAGPYGLNYGYGKHYGSVVVPNNPYKSTYGDYYGYGSSNIDNHQVHPPANSNELNTFAQPIDNNISPVGHYKLPIHILKPLIKAGAFLTTMAILNKKTLGVPSKLNPSGMILSSKLLAR